MTTTAQALGTGAGRLRAAGVDAPRRDARLLLARATGVAAPALLDPCATVADEHLAAYTRDLRRRENREPVSRIFGEREFWGLRFRLSEQVLDPRPDSETVVEAALAACGDPPPRRIVDFGTGSGCLLVALLHEFPAAWGVGVDASPGAAAVARANAEANGVAARAAFVAADWGAPLTGPFDLIVANPPYVASAAIDGLAPEVAVFDPRKALDGGADGLDAIRGLAPYLARLAAPGAHVMVEVGEGHAAAVSAVLAAAGLGPGEAVRDLGGHLRVVTARAKSDQRP